MLSIENVDYERIALNSKNPALPLRSPYLPGIRISFWNKLDDLIGNFQLFNVLIIDRFSGSRI